MLAEETLALCRAAGLDFGISFCLTDRGVMEVGLREHKAARETLHQAREVGRAHEDPHAAVDTAILSLKLALSESGSSPALSAVVAFTDSEVPRSPHATYRALCSLVHAAAAEPDEATRALEHSRRLSKTAEARYLGTFAELILGAVAGDVHTPRKLGRLIHEAAEAECLATFVLAYRAYPRLLKMIPHDDADAQAIARRTIGAAKDHRLAHQAGFDIPGSDRRPLLTRRESEVYDLLTQGLTNREIARRLFISTSTAKVHVHNILEKTGMRSRVDIIVSARESQAVD